ncbi:hypothetical protein NLX83_13055 [Allokutzneria sp. A3M-2-11 16]|uniref:hypothetical protein n=1 Tax=Allokutzneria sp. A3M-2-11 16 TaxID=2962043 RepID=UPI0020B68E7B|nr:hypothetical protein [Allokutzneria sp. A3M-2-11 16]MCP3800187.1 hypothetical protein [Allokutzneria sp. A3M-2-11 16]
MKRTLTVLTVVMGTFALMTPAASAASSATSEASDSRGLLAKVTCTRNGSVNKEHSYNCEIKNYDSVNHAFMKKSTPKYEIIENPFGKGKSYTVYVGNVQAGKKLHFNSFSGYIEGHVTSIYAEGPQRTL